MKKAYLTQSAVKWLLEHVEIYVKPSTGSFDKNAVKEIQFLMAVGMYDQDYKGGQISSNEEFTKCEFGPVGGWFKVNAKGRVYEV